jgi:superfamily II DNA or RNA helicase
MLGPEGVKLIRKGGKYDIDIDAQVSLEADRLWLSLPETTVTVSDNVRTPGRLRVECLSCGGPCEHGGALLSLVLEEKMALGLAAPPPERVPVESLSEEALVARALEERRGRAKTERMAVRSRNPKSLWTDYLVTNRASGKTYRVALRGWSHGESYCSCPDFRKNTLGTCKHILHVQEKVRRRFPAASRNRPYRPKEIAVHLLYGSELELHVLAPENGDKAVARLLRPFRNHPVEDIHGLLEAVRKLTARGEEVTIYPDAEEFINQQLFRERVTAAMKAIRRNPARHRLRKELLKAELLPYQLEGIAFAVGAGRAVLADDMGLGKTIQGIGVAEMLALEAGIRKVLIICPTSLKSQWRSEIERFSDRECRLILGTAAERAEQYENDSFFTICNYEQVLRDILAIERTKWDLIILDEGQRIKNWEAKTSRIIKGLKSPFALVLSGTPLENRLDDLFSIVEFIDDRRLGPAFRFFNHHRVADEKGRVLGYKNLDELRRRLKPVLLRRTRSSVRQQLPPRRTEVVRITPTEEQAELHAAHMQIVTWIVRKQYLTEMDLLRLQKALLMCRRAANATSLVDKKEPGYSSKLEHLDDLLAELLAEKGRKILLFSEWTTMLDLIEPLLEKHAARYVRLDGSVPQKKRQGLVNAFQKTPDCQVFITTNAGSTGLNLQAAPPTPAPPA